MRRLSFSLLTALLIAPILSGCVHGTHVATGNQRPSVAAESVRLYQSPPSHYKVLGMVSAQAQGDGQDRLDRATQELKHQAAILGANGIILNQSEAAGLVGRITTLSGQAIYVLPEFDAVPWRNGEDYAANILR